MSHLTTKPTKWHVRPAKTQISLGIRPVWPASSLSTWKPGSLATHWAYIEDSDQTGWMPRLIWVFAGCTCHFVCFVMRWLIFLSHPGPNSSDYTFKETQKSFDPRNSSFNLAWWRVGSRVACDRKWPIKYSASSRAILVPDNKQTLERFLRCEGKMFLDIFFAHFQTTSHSQGVVFFLSLHFSRKW